MLSRFGFWESELMRGENEGAWWLTRQSWVGPHILEILYYYFVRGGMVVVVLGECGSRKKL